MTNKDRKAEVRERMTKTGESYTQARRQVIKARPRRQPSAEPEKVYINYTLRLGDTLEFDADVWANALSTERRRMVEEAVGEQLDADFALYGGQGIAECVELEFSTTTMAEIDAEQDAEQIEFASRPYAGIGEDDDWPGGVVRPIASDSYVIVHQDVEYVVLRRQRGIVAVYDVADGAFKALNMWPKEIETR